jgi:hypothetical protein
MNTYLKTATMVVAMAFLGGCATKEGPATPGTMQEEPPVVAVSNNNWSDVVVYAERPTGNRVRLGTVTSMGNQTLRIPRALLNSLNGLRLVATPIASPNQFASEPLHVWPGQTIELRIENQMSISTVRVW